MNPDIRSSPSRDVQIDIVTSSDSEHSKESRRLALILANPIIKNMRDQELGKMVLGVSVPITTAFTIYFFYVKSPPLIVRFVVVLLSIGCTAILNGLLLRDYCPLTATLMEIVGIAIVLLAVDGIVGSFLPSGLLWIEGIICVSTVAPFIAAATAVILPPADPEPHVTPH